ncbi:MAG TPA: FecR domain-containing protein [Rhizomicrobium sp.]|nr:FecR domain-containing protein [Rhizomicrobium sp.]
MSDRKTPPAEIARADAASRLIDRQLSEGWKEEDETNLENWMDESLAHRVAYWRLEAAWEQTDRLAALRRPMRETPVQTSPARNWPFFARIAAAVVVVGALGAGAAFYAAEPAAKTYATEIGGRETITLRDGSQIELNTDSAVRVALSEKERKVWLDKGEVFFQVRHNAKRPFVVIASGHRIVDIGTKFTVRRVARGLSVAVTEGKVQLESSDGKAKPTTLVAGQVALADAKSVSIAKKPVEVLSTELKWRTGLIEFRYSTLAEAAKEFNRYNRNKLVIADPAAAKLTVVGTFGTNDVDAFVRLAKRVFGLRVVQHEDETVISR